MRFLKLFFIIILAASAQAQLYVLKNPAKDSANMIRLYDSLPIMCDSFYAVFLRQDLTNLRKFVPGVKFLRSTFDTLNIEYREEQVVYRQQYILRNLQKDYRKILKNAEKRHIKLDKITINRTDYEYGEDKDGNEYCYVTVEAKRRKHEYEIKYLAIKLNRKWFVGDELSMEEI